MSAATGSTDAAQVVERQAEALRSRFPVAASDKPAVRAEAEALAAACESLRPPPAELALDVARLLRKAGSHALALRLLQQWRPEVPGEQRAALFLEMELEFLAGHRERGEALLAQLEEGGKLRPSWQRAIARIRQRQADAASTPDEGAEVEPTETETGRALPEVLSDDLLERVRQVTACFPVPEAGKFRVRSAALAAVDAYRQEADPADELTYAVIRLLGRLKRYQAALHLMQQRKPRIAPLAVEIDAYEIYLYYKTQQPAEGERRLEAFRVAGHALPYAWKKAIAKLGRTDLVAQARETYARVEDELSQLARDVDLPEHLPVAQLVMGPAAPAEDTLRFIDARLRRLRQMHSAAQADLRAFDQYHSARLLFTAGFSWSGSGAVSSFLRQHRLVTLPFGTSEMAYLQGHGRPGIFAFIQPGVVEPEDMRRRLARFLLESVVSVQRQHYSVLKHCQADPDCVERLGALIDDFHAAMLAQDALDDLAVRRRVLGRFMQRMFSVRGGSHVLLNNIFLAPRAALIGTMDDALFVVVERDARDQYTARRAEGAHTGDYPVASFLALIKRNRAGFQAIRAAAPPDALARQMMLLGFEDFVRDAALRDRVLERAGLPADGLVPDPARFDPAVSARNIGIHRAALTADEIAQIEAVGIYLP